MSKTKDSGEDLGKAFDELGSGVINAVAGCAGAGCELNGLVDSEGREVNIVLWAVLDISTEVSAKLLRRNGVVVDIAFDLVVLLALVGEGLEEGRASSTRATEYDYGELSEWKQRE